MSNIQVNTGYRASHLQNMQVKKPAVSIPVNNNYDDGDDASNNSKKSRKALFNKMQRSSPKLIKSFDEMIISEKIAYFNSLSDKEKLNLLNKSYNNTLGYVNSLSDEQKRVFLAKLVSAVNQTQNGDTPNPSDSGYDSGITNIMMIIVKAFVNNMNTEALDELEKTFEANLINKYLQNIQNQMKQQIAKQEKLASEIAKGSGSNGKTLMTIIGVAVGVLTVVGMFFPPAEVFSALFDNVGVVADAVEPLGAEEEVSLDMLEPDNKAAIDAADNTRLGRLKQVPINSVTKMFENGNGQGAWNITKGLGKSAMYGVGAYYAGTTLYSLKSKKGQQNEQNKINNCQSEIGSGTSASDILNNNEQQTSKRISDDSQRISQASGYVSEAINMLGNAMSFRV